MTLKLLENTNIKLMVLQKSVQQGPLLEYLKKLIIPYLFFIFYFFFIDTLEFQFIVLTL